MTNRRDPAARPPLDAAALDRLALAYVGRYATSRAALVRYLSRKLAERGWAGDGAADPRAIAERLAGLGYIDERELAAAKGRSHARKGLGSRRLASSLDALGIGADERKDALDEAAGGAWDAALRYAERRRLGPFAAHAPDPAGRRRAFGAMIRAGHSAALASRIVAAAPGDVPLRDE